MGDKFKLEEGRVFKMVFTIAGPGCVRASLSYSIKYQVSAVCEGILQMELRAHSNCVSPLDLELGDKKVQEIRCL